MEKRYNDDLGREENALYEEKNGSKHDLSDSELFKKKKYWQLWADENLYKYGTRQAN